MCIVPPNITRDDLMQIASGIDIDLQFIENAEDLTLADLDMIGERLNWRLQSDKLQSHDGLASIKGKAAPYWRQVRKELCILMCTDNKKYKKLRADFDSVSGKLATPFVAAVSAAIGSAIGITASIAAPLCALALYGVSRIGIEAYCALEREKLGLESTSKKRTL